MENEYLCTLHKQHDCTYADYNHRKCNLKLKDGFATCSCQYQIQAVVLAAAEPEESPENVVQQTNGGSEASTQIAADTMDLKDIF